IIPGTFVFASVGNGLGAVLDAGQDPDLGIIFKPEVLGPLVALAVISLLPIGYKKYQAKKKRAATSEAA
ncbi:MAG: TVP38/TMEM64 family protein, partial [Alphaproteobacteria bacterium]|nr:TVP38/TMEM64 family protein [Alphaproteobacteria bacterium]